MSERQYDSPDDKLLQNQIQYWKKIVDVQQHFNDIEMRIRALFLTLMGALLGAVAGFAGFHGADSSSGLVKLGEASSVPISFLLAVAFVLVLLFWYMDAGWYHMYLRAAAVAGGEMEKIIGRKMEIASLSDAITMASHEPQLGKKRNSIKRLTLFYGVIAYILLSLTLYTRFPNHCLAVSAIVGLALLIIGWLLWGEKP